MLLQACGTDDHSGDGGGQLPAGGNPAVDSTAASAPLAPITISYDVVGTAIVGQPVSVNLQFASTGEERLVRLQYRSGDVDSLSFPEAQPEDIELRAPGGGETISQQVTVIPQREGRVFLTVSTSIDTPQGSIIRSLSVPIQVGGAPDDAAADDDPGQSSDGGADSSAQAGER